MCFTNFPVWFPKFCCVFHFCFFLAPPIFSSFFSFLLAPPGVPVSLAFPGTTYFSPWFPVFFWHPMFSLLFSVFSASPKVFLVVPRGVPFVQWFAHGFPFVFSCGFPAVPSFSRFSLVFPFFLKRPTKSVHN